MESEWSRAEDNLGGHGETKGPSVFKSSGKPHCAERQIHKLRHVISELVQKLPDEMRKMPDVDDLAAYGCRTRMHVVRLVSPPLAGEDHSKDIDFSANGIRLRWDAGYNDT